MQKLNLREHYPELYKENTYVEVSDDVFDVFAADKRAEEAYKRKLYRYGAHFSLDCNDGIEKALHQHLRRYLNKSCFVSSCLQLCHHYLKSN